MNSKSYLSLVCFLIFSAAQLHSQLTQWPSPGMEYGSIYVCNPFDCASWFNTSTPRFIAKDTCGQTWYLMNGYMTRMEGGRYYAAGSQCGDDRLLYDFNLQVGDVFVNGLTGTQYSVLEIGDLPMLNGTTRRYQVVRDFQFPNAQPLQWVEGIGDTYSGFYPYRDFEGGHSRFICLKDSTGMIYEAGDPWNLDCDSLTCITPYPQLTHTCRNDTLLFTNLTAEPASNFLWDFGDGTTSSEVSPSHIYDEPGCYYVTLNAEAECIPGFWRKNAAVVNFEAPAWWKKSTILEQRIFYGWQFLDSQHAWAYDSLFLYKTEDGGQHWTNVPYPGTPKRIKSIDFQDFNHGIVVKSIGNSNLYTELLWTDNGVDFKTVNRGPNYSPTAIKRIDGTTAIDVEHYQDPAITLDGGNTWQTIQLAQPITLVQDIQHFPSGQTYLSGLAQLGIFEAYFCRSNDLENWDCTHHPTLPYLQPFTFLDTLNGWGNAGTGIYRTYDAGRTWTRIYERSIFHGYIFELVMADSLNGWVSGHQTGIWRTHDGGYTWEQEACDLIETHIRGLVAIDSTHAYAIKYPELIEWNLTPFQSDTCPMSMVTSANYTSDYQRLILFPNPATDMVYYRIEGSKVFGMDAPLVFDIFNAHGQKVRTVSASSEGSIDVRLLPNGIYSVRNRSGGIGLIGKIVIARE